MASSGGKSVRNLDAEAATWAARLDAGRDGTHAGLDDWLAEDPRHAGALLRAQAILATFDPVETAAPGDAPLPMQSSSPQARWQTRWAFGGLGLVCAASLATVLVTRQPAETYETGIGEMRSVALSDGSSVAIDAKSRIDVDFDANRRDVHLMSGKVLFRATHKARRPFRVLVGDIVVTDIGTAFQITREDRSDTVEVLVTEGAVRVDSASGTLDLTEGQRARISQAGSGLVAPEKVRLAPADMDRTLAWRDGRLDLDGETLDSAVADINRHSRVQLRVGNPALGREKLYGSFRLDDASGFARTVAAGLGARLETTPDGLVIGAGKK